MAARRASLQRALSCLMLRRRAMNLRAHAERPRRVVLAWVGVAIYATAIPAQAQASTPPQETTPLPDLDPQQASPAPAVIDLRPRPQVQGAGEEAPTPTAEREAPAPSVDPSAQPPLKVSFGLGPEAPGSEAELAWVRRLETSLAASNAPAVQARQTLVGGPAARRVCRKGDDDLVIQLGYLPDRDDPVWLPYDCALDEPLGVRAAAAADSPDWIGVLWDEHDARVAQGAKERSRGPNKRVKTALIAGSATLAVAGAVTLILLNTLRPTRTVLKVQPE